MFDTFNSENRADWSARYAGTFGVLHRDEAKGINNTEIVRIVEVQDTKVLFENVAGLMLSAYLDSGIKFEFIPLRTGWVTDKTHWPFFIRRVPARQWKRGICFENTFIGKLYDSGVVQQHANFDLVAAILLDKSNFKESYQRFKDKKSKCCALNKFFALNSDSVFFLNKRVGSHDGSTLKLYDPMCQQELQDCISRNNYPLTVEQL